MSVLVVSAGLDNPVGADDSNLQALLADLIKGVVGSPILITALDQNASEFPSTGLLNNAPGGWLTRFCSELASDTLMV